MVFPAMLSGAGKNQNQVSAYDFETYFRRESMSNGHFLLHVNNMILFHGIDSESEVQK